MDAIQQAEDTIKNDVEIMENDCAKIDCTPVRKTIYDFFKLIYDIFKYYTKFKNN
jgi:hypothetical protein